MFFAIRSLRFFSVPTCPMDLSHVKFLTPNRIESCRIFSDSCPHIRHPYLPYPACFEAVLPFFDPADYRETIFPRIAQAM